MRKPKFIDAQSIEQLREEMEKRNAVLEAMKTAFFNRSPFKDVIPEYEDLHVAAEEFIRAHYNLQKARFGRVRFKMTVPDVLRD